MIQGIDVVFLHASDMNLAQWYAEILGLEISHSDGPWIEFKTQTQSRFAVEHVPSSPSGAEKQSVMISFRVRNIYQAVEMLSKRNVRFYPSVERTIFKAGSSLVATFMDPAGNWIQLSQPGDGT